LIKKVKRRERGERERERERERESSIEFEKSWQKVNRVGGAISNIV